jgi:maltooligosyltrehalose synthase
MPIRLTAPEVPDTFQGTEYWDFSLVDPDNRSPIDYDLRSASLNATAPSELVAHWADGRIKQATMARVLALRSKSPALFSDGEYFPIQIIGPSSEHVGAFMRRLHRSAAITVFVRSVAHLLDADGSLRISPSHWKPSHWKETRLVVPPEFHGKFSNALAPNGTVTINGELAVERFLALPVALLTNISE